VKQVLFNAGDTASKGAPLVQFEAEEWTMTSFRSVVIVSMIRFIYSGSYFAPC
jgi:hypothetical protein